VRQGYSYSELRQHRSVGAGSQGLVVGSENWLFKAPGCIDRIEARFSGTAFSPHRHDTYALGITLRGVQSFDYRGASRHSLPGQLVILHPDELHDGRAGDDRPFQYRTVYVAPVDIQRILAGRVLPFIKGGVSDDPPLRRALQALLDDLDHPLDDFEVQQGLYDLAISLLRASGVEAVGKAANRAAVWSARDYIEANLKRPIRLDDLEHITGHDRWQLSRDFRALLGASPYRYLIFRRLDNARRMMAAGAKLADVAHASGFSDQSHFIRHFKKAYGMTPKRWATHEGSRSV
jgi:AraC-like DNA-binding protein